jgi:membrane-bound inhibitor of C-type lysozyme
VVRETLNYQCDADQRISVEYINVGANSLAVVRIGEETVIASNVMAASGAKYAGGRYEWWTKGDEATLYDLTKGENAPGVNCRKTG